MPRTNSYASSLVLDADIMEEVMSEFESLRRDGTLSKDDVKHALKITGFELTGHEFRDLMDREAKGIDTVSAEMFALLYAKVREMKDMSRSFRKDLVLKEKKDLTVRRGQGTCTCVNV